MGKNAPATALVGVFILPTLLAGGCTISLANLTASLGGSTPAARGTIRVLFINNTPHRAVFTYGTFDQTDQFSQPDFRQFGVDETNRHLDGNSESSIRPIDGQSPLFCAGVFSIGSPNLRSLIDENLAGVTVIDEALVDGVEFFDIDEGGDSDAKSVGFAPPFEALLGADFPCAALLIIRFELSDLGSDPFRIDFELIPSGSTR